MAVLNHVDTDDGDQMKPSADSLRRNLSNHVGLNLEDEPGDASTSGSEDGGGRRNRVLARRNSNEMHPLAISKALDAITMEWAAKQSTSAAASAFPHHPSSHDNAAPPRLPLTRREVEIVKLIFSLMDVDGDLRLGQGELTQFIQRILGDTISEDKARRYLAALDCNRDGQVDLDDLLSCASMLKAMHRHASLASQHDGGTFELWSRLPPWTRWLLAVAFAVGVGLPCIARTRRWWSAQINSRTWLKKWVSGDTSGVVALGIVLWIWTKWRSRSLHAPKQTRME
ncbi:hypothetical protein, variant [Aphanomyces invadans]|uniref:EF-hand domain-containing protein n=1 Tax=Aphanomyces invadans TaxID=157072 RepID=A0A024T7R2_9STRA|nr:hypothetical protein, variant [Aphanomyces invadans]ETV90040.1 hypothetical protein, variant [Aphanomyces invadans]|eukprot:XP_008881334.1 hypothetical protein, variant [Aphanomyces invadans]